MFRSSLGVAMPPQPLHHHHGHHAAGMQGSMAAFQYQHQYQYQQPQQQQQHAVYSHHQSQMNARFNGSAPEDDEVFRQLWYEPEHEESLSALHMRLSGNGHGHGSSSYSANNNSLHDHHLKQEAYGAEVEEDDEPVIEMPPSSTNSLLFEPLDLPKSNTSTGSFSLEQTLKDAFLNFTPEASTSTAMSPLEKMQASSLSYLRGPSSSGSRSGSSGLYDSRSLYDQQHQEYNSSSSNNNISSTSSNSSILNAILGFQTTPWASNNNNVQDTATTTTTNNNNMNGYQQQSNSMRQLLLSTNPPANMNMNMLESSNNPIWISASMLSTPTSQLPAPELGRKISNKKSKARRPAKASGGRRSAVASALVLSLAGITSTGNGSYDDESSRRSGMSSPSASSVHSDTDNMSTTESGDKNAKGKKCVESGCVRRAQSNSRCKAHGGGARCQYTGPGGCVRSSQGGGFCRAHGGGKRCEFPGCVRGQQRKGRCYVHGGIRKCQMGDCEKKDRGNGFCISHGGGKRCEHPGCSRAVRRGLLCQLHEIAS